MEFDSDAFKRPENQYALQQKFQELTETMARRHSLIKMKIGFSVGLLGVGALGKIDLAQSAGATVDLMPILMFAPWVPPLFDVLITSEIFSIRRIAYFLEVHLPQDSLEPVWQRFVEGNRFTMFRVGALGFNALPAGLAFYLWLYQTGKPFSLELTTYFLLPVLFTMGWMLWETHRCEILLMNTRDLRRGNSRNGSDS